MTTPFGTPVVPEVKMTRPPAAARVSTGFPAGGPSNSSAEMRRHPGGSLRSSNVEPARKRSGEPALAHRYRSHSAEAELSIGKNAILL